MAEATATETKTEVKTETPEVKAAVTAITAEPAKTEVKTEAKVEEKKTSEPIKYDVKIPEKSSVTQKDVDAILAQAKEKGLSNEQAQMLIDARHDQAAKTLAEYQTREVERVKAEAPKWLEQLKADKEIGGERFNESIENAKRVITKYGDKEFTDFLNNSGLGNHPMVARIFAKIGKAFGESHWVEGSHITPKQETNPAEKLYDKTPK